MDATRGGQMESRTGMPGVGNIGRPFATISECAAVAAPGTTCLIESGTYRETVRPANSGTDGSPITFRAAPNATVTISGADAVSGFVQDAADPTVWSAPSSMAAGYDDTQNPDNATIAANQVFANGTMMTEAQYPNAGSDPMAPTFAQIGGWVSGQQTTNGTFADHGLPRDVGDLTGSTIYFFKGWSAISGTVTGNTATTVSYEVPPSDRPLYPGGSNNAFRITGARALLDADGEWFYDHDSGRLLIKSETQPVGIEAKKRNYAVDLAGRSHIVVENVAVTSATLRTDDDSSNNVFRGISASYVSHFMTAQYDQSIPYGGIYDAHKLDTGILLHGTHNQLVDSIVRVSAGNGVSVAGTGHVIRNSLIRDVSYGGTYTAPIAALGGSSGVTIEKNTIYGSGRDGINLNEVRKERATYNDFRITGNDISNYAALTYDLGGIYACCWTDLRGTRIDHNKIHSPVSAGNGLHLDNGTWGATVDHNAIYDLKPTASYPAAGVAAGGHPSGAWEHALENKIYNNTIDPGPGGRGYWDYYADSGARADIRNNIMLGPVVKQADTPWVSNLQDPDPTITFEDAVAHDYRLAAGSPAAGAGVPILDITEGVNGADGGAFENGVVWTAGCTISELCNSAKAPTYPGATVLPPVVGPPVNGFIDNKNAGPGLNQWTFSGTWGHANDSYSNQVDATATVRFQSDLVQLLVFQDPLAGIVAVSINGGEETLVDLYAPSRSASIAVFERAGLDPTIEHTLRVRVTGTKNPAATNTFATVDGADIDG